MSAKRTHEIQVITSGSMTGTSVITSSTVRCDSMTSPSVQFVWTGTPNGTFVVEGSNDNATWTALTLSTSLTATGAAGNHLVNLFPFPFKWFRCTYTNSSSTGTLNAYFFGKEQ